MRLRPTACGSTLRETARPSRAGGGPATKCSENNGEAVRRPCWKARSKSARARTRTWRGNRAVMGGTAQSRSSAKAGRGGTASGRQDLATLGAATGQDLAAVGGLHAGTEAVVALALEVAGLVGALGGHGRDSSSDASERTGDSSGCGIGRSSSALRGAVALPCPPRVVGRRRARWCACRGAVVVCPFPRFRDRRAPLAGCAARRRHRAESNVMDAWPRCLERLEAEFPAEDVHAWLKPLQATWRDDATVLYAPNAFVRDEVRDRYLERIRELLGHFAGTPEVTLEIGSLPRAAAGRPTVAATAAVQDVAAFSGNLDGHYTFDNFVGGRSNQL